MGGRPNRRITGALPIAIALIAQSVPADAARGAQKSSKQPTAAAPTVRLKMPGPEVQNLMLGTWTIHVKYEPSAELPDGGVAEGKEVWRSGPGGRSVVEEYEEKGAAGEFHGLGVAWWEEEEQGQRVIWCDDSDPDGCQLSKNVSKWEGDSLVYIEETEENGQKLVRQEIFTDINATSFTQILKEGPTAAELKTTTTILATKPGREAPAKRK